MVVLKIAPEPTDWKDERDIMPVGEGLNMCVEGSVRSIAVEVM
jgi:hypothetical protein